MNNFTLKNFEDVNFLKIPDHVCYSIARLNLIILITTAVKLNSFNLSEVRDKDLKVFKMAFKVKS